MELPAVWADLAERLAALGYVSSRTPHAPAATDLPDSKDCIGQYCKALQDPGASIAGTAIRCH